MLPQILLGAFLTISLTSCTWLEKLFSQPDSNESGLTSEQAKIRSSVISNVAYDLSFDLEKDEKTFSGKTQINFDLLRKIARVRIDLTGGKVLSLLVNGEKEKINYNEMFIDVESKHLQEGANTIEITYDMRYSSFGAGLYRFKDPEDGNVYVYSDFEPFDANRLFPCFDQPDLKATYKTKVRAPKEWTVVTSVREDSTAVVGNTSEWIFPESAKFSTYIYSLHAGPYHIWEDNTHKIPLRLMARQSLKNYVEKDHWFSVTKKGFDYFNDYFGYDYPFVKYDQVIVPDFNSGAMENVAAVTFSERFLKKGAYTYDDRLSIASVILHEMAHMWFGNLVTMKWWNDLWLNESFASIMAARALHDATEFDTSWKHFFSRMKQWAYWEDELSTSHPIETEVASTNEAFANFDGITYGKGASVLKQIIYYIGEDNFKKGIQGYFKEYAYKNTSLSDFIGALEKGSETKLDWWSKQWLQTTGINTVSVDFSCKDGTISEAKLTQTSKLKAPGLRKHRSKVALIYKNKQSDELEVKDVFDVYFESKTTHLNELASKDCPDAVYPNYGDYDYVKVDLDDKSLTAFRDGMNTINDDLLRLMIWRNQWDMVRDGKIPVQDYLALVTKNLPGVREKDILKSVLSTLISTRNGNSPALQYIPVDTDKGREYFSEISSQIEEIMWEKLNETIADTDAHLLWFESFASFSRSKDAIENLKTVYIDRKKYSTIHKNQDFRWKMLWQMSTYASIDIREWLAGESELDGSDSGKNWQLAIEVAQNVADVKEIFYNRLIAENSGDSASTQKIISSSLFPEGQEIFRVQFSERYFKDLLALSKTRNDIYLNAFTTNLVPLNCEPKIRNRLMEFVSNNSQLQETIIRNLNKNLEEDEKCIKLREFSSKTFTNPKRI